MSFEVGKKYNVILNCENRMFDVLEYSELREEYFLVWDDGESQWACAEEIMENVTVLDAAESVQRVRISILAPINKKARNTIRELQRNLDPLDQVWNMLDDILFQLDRYQYRHPKNDPKNREL